VAGGESAFGCGGGGRVAIGIVLAGRRNTAGLAAAAPDVEWESLVPIAGRPMLGHVVEALTATPAVDRVIVAGPPAFVAAGVLVVPPGERVTASLRHALDAAPSCRAPGEELLIATGDAPLLTAAAVGALIDGARRRGLHLAYPIVRRELCEASFPGVHRTYVRLREGAFTGGNCFYLQGTAVDSALALLERFYAERKRPLRLARLLGWGLLLGLVLGRARLEDAEAAGSRLLGHPAGAVVAEDPGVGVDVDRPEDLEICRAFLARGR